ncbi:MAG: Crp/Fnr family transcriptional regulator [Desulfatirhabdiaceae bacterium]
MTISTPISGSFPQSEIVSGIPAEQISDILNRGARKLYRPGDVLFRQGFPADQCYFVLTGRMKLVKTHEQGKETILRYIGPGELAAAVAVFKETDYPVTAEIIEDSEVVGWNKNTIVALMLQYPNLAVNMLKMAIDRLDEVQNRYMEICSEQAGQRIARALLRIMKHAGKKTEPGILIDFRLSRQDIAEYSGTTLYTVSRILSTWEKKGWIQSGRERITITNPHALVVFSENG